MQSDDKPLVYLILGAAGSERRDILADLIDGGLVEGDKPAVLLAQGEVAADDAPKLPRISLWSRDGKTIEAELPQDATHVFFMTDGRDSPIDQIEAFKLWIEAQGGELATVISIVNCQLAEKTPELMPWFEACVHFSDVVLLTKRDGVDNKWLSDFIAHFQKQFYPCVFEMVKGNRVKNPALILDPNPRRMSHYFEEEQEWVITDEDGEELDESDQTEEEEEVHAAPEQDPYMALDAAGRRQKRLPEISRYLS